MTNEMYFSSASNAHDVLALMNLNNGTVDECGTMKKPSEQANQFAQAVANFSQLFGGGNIENLIAGITGMTRMESVMSNYTISEYARYWVENVIRPIRKGTTADRYLTSIELLEKYSIAQIKIKDIVADDITEYLYEVAESYAHTTVKKQRTIVTAPLRHALGNKLIGIDVTKGISMPKPEDCGKPPREIKDFSLEEQAKLWVEIEKFENYCDYALGFQLATGTRISEVLALIWDDIALGAKPQVHIHKTVARLNREKKTIVSPTPKTPKSNRGVPLEPRAVMIIEKLKATAPNEWVFSDEDGERLTYDSVRSRLKTICKRAGVKYQPTHANRHTFTTNLIEAGADIKVVSKILGHADPAFTKKVYDHLRGDGYDQMYDAIMQFAQ